MFCQKCGKESLEGAAFCNGCGSALSAPVAPVAPVAPAPAPQQPKKKTGLIIGIVVAVVAVVAIVIGVLFATGVFGGDSSSSNKKNDKKDSKPKTEQTTKAEESTTNRDEPSKTDALVGAWTGSYKASMWGNGFIIDCTRVLTLEFKDGKCYMSGQERLDMSKEDFISQSHQYYAENYTEAEIEEELEYMGYSTLDEMFSAQYDGLNSDFNEVECYRYDEENQRIYFWDEDGTEEDALYEDITLSGNTLTMEGFVYTRVS